MHKCQGTKIQFMKNNDDLCHSIFGYEICYELILGLQIQFLGGEILA